MDRIEKKCSKCSAIKPLSEFYISSKGPSSLCKKCYSARHLAAWRSKAGFISGKYRNQIAASKKRRHIPPSYTETQLREWLMEQPLFHQLYDAWVESGYKKSLSPSIDRISDQGPYSFDNIQLMTWAENRDKGHDHRRRGLNNNRSTAIIQCDLNGNELREFHSMSEASRVTGVLQGNIWACCNAKVNKAKGFKWKYKNDEEANKFNGILKRINHATIH